LPSCSIDIAQHPLLFNDWVRMNIAYGRPEVS
jgi:hypothetical protein